MQLAPLPRPAERLQIATPHGSADSLLVAGYASLAKSLVILASSAQTALRLKDEIAWFAPDKRIVLLPDWETLPYDHFSPHHELISERLASLWQIRSGEAEIVNAAHSLDDWQVGEHHLGADGQFHHPTGLVADPPAGRSLADRDPGLLQCPQHSASLLAAGLLQH